MSAAADIWPAKRMTMRERESRLGELMVIAYAVELEVWFMLSGYKDRGAFHANYQIVRSRVTP